MEDDQITQGEQAAVQAGWILETCRFCGKRMYATHQRPVVNKQTQQQYLETENVCPPCDNWVVTKIPYALARTLSATIWLPTREEIAQLPRKERTLA